jgi:signal transduction histidine kinase
MRLRCLEQSEAISKQKIPTNKNSSKLASAILRAQDAERRKIARDLHDSVGQYLACIRLDLHELAAPPSERHRPKEECLSECIDAVDKCSSEIRTLSYLMHPPLLDELGLGPAVRWYMEGLSKRTGLVAQINMPPEIPRMRSDVEVTLFRTLQESLTNVHRHSGASAVEVDLQLDAHEISLRVKDNGHGIPEQRLRDIQRGASEVGVGFAGMKERVSSLGGSFEVRSGRNGTSVTTTLPVT